MSQIAAKITADSSAYRKAIEDANNVLKAFTKEESIAAESLRKVYDVTQDQIDAYKKVTDAMNKATGGTKNIRQASSALKSDIEKLRIQWDNLSDTAKKSKFGQAMANSIRTAEDRLKTMQMQMGVTQKATASASTAMGGMVGIVGKLAPAIGAGSAAFKVLKDAFFDSEKNIDNWGRAVNVAKGTYQVFLDTLNKGDWSGFFDKVRIAKKEMSEIYDLNDTFGSMQQNNSNKIASIKLKISKLRADLAYDKDNESLKQQLLEAQHELERTLVDMYKTVYEAGLKEITASMGTEASETMREVLADDLIKNGQKAMNKAKKRLEYLNRNTGEKGVYTVEDESGNLLQMEYEKKIWETGKGLADERLAILGLLKNESDELRKQGQQHIDEAYALQTQLEQLRRELAEQLREKPVPVAKNEKIDLMSGRQMLLDVPEANKPGKTDMSSINSYLYEKEYKARVDAARKAKEEENKIFAEQAPKQIVGDVKDITSTTSALYDSLSSLSDIDNPFQFFDSLAGIAQNVLNVVDTINGLGQTMKALSVISSMTTATEVANSEAKATASGTEAAADTVAATASTFKAHSAIPFVGVAIAAAMVSAMIASIAASKSRVPKFNRGGIITGPTLGLMGEYSGSSNNPEVVAPLDRLKVLLADKNDVGGGNVRFEIEGRTLVGLIKKENNLSSRR
jgi:hypothetical protein